MKQGAYLDKTDNTPMWMPLFIKFFIENYDGAVKPQNYNIGWNIDESTEKGIKEKTGGEGYCQN